MLKKWSPLLGGVILIAAAIAEVFGYADIAHGARAIGGATGVTEQSPVAAGDIAAFVTAASGAVSLGIGIWRKVSAEISKARG